MVISVIMLFENRSSLIHRNKFRFKSDTTRILWIIANTVGCGGTFAPVFFNLPEQLEAKLLILKGVPCPAKEFFTEPIQVLTTGGFWNTYMTVTCTFIYILLIFQLIFFTSCCIYYLFISKTSQVSSQTRRIQIRGFYGIVFQTFIPILLMMIPLTIFANKKKDGSYDQVQNNVMIITVCIQNGATSLSIVLVHHPYRKFLKSIFWRSKKNETSVVHVTSEVCTRS
ncbi:hypothetical protein GCK72_007203 [Caenorhabditis remanei]|uniref:Uncharacterized protein n=1 Tax=Caenorhabditis remanei TaxID=31234 RepID=A0A6A5HKW7_CAERE|nr:hypothetical protein GCK72_007203 [Caenorhabditis remanei]KAF1767244.1 hypothetical protein GCK72_007203 [Caenorhabditis remanei]